MRPGPAARTLLLLALILIPLFSCSYEERICVEEDYPTWRPDGPGAACFREGTEPSPGYVRYPEGDVPERLRDDYRPLRRYPRLRDWARDYVAWYEAGHRGEPPAMPDVDAE